MKKESELYIYRITKREYDDSVEYFLERKRKRFFNFLSNWKDCRNLKYPNGMWYSFRDISDVEKTLEENLISDNRAILKRESILVEVI